MSVRDQCSCKQLMIVTIVTSIHCYITCHSFLQVDLLKRKILHAKRDVPYVADPYDDEDEDARDVEGAGEEEYEDETYERRTKKKYNVVNKSQGGKSGVRLRTFVGNSSKMILSDNEEEEENALEVGNRSNYRYTDGEGLDDEEEGDKEYDEDE